MSESVGNLERLSDKELQELRQRLDAALAARGLAGRPETTHASQATACRLFTINDGLRRLGKADLETLDRAFLQWVQESRDTRTRRSRERVYIVFLVLRYTGARLGEVLALDEERDIDVDRCLARIRQTVSDKGQASAREVPLPEEVVSSIISWRQRNNPTEAASTATEGLFRLDPGFLRRKFQEQEARSGLPRELLNPRCLRNSRATELLQGGMPLRAVQAMLGYSTSDCISAHVTLAEKDLNAIVRSYCEREFGMETSARNTFKGQVVRVSSSPVVCEIVLRTDSGLEIAATITNHSREKLGLEKGRQATALVKATWVTLQKNDTPPATSARNAFPGTVARIISDDVMAEVQGRLDDGTPVCALVTTESLSRLGISQGDPFVFMFKAMSVIIS